MSMAIRVVLDTNVVVSSLVFRGAAAGRVRLAWQQGLVLPLVCMTTVQELMRVLSYPKFRLSIVEQRELLADYLPYTQTVQIPIPPPFVPQCRDQFDLPFMHLAVAGEAQVLVSGDRDLLAIAAEFERLSSCPIVSVDEFCQSGSFSRH